MTTNPYDALQVPRCTKDMDRIKQAYLRQRSKYHTDKPENIDTLMAKHPHLNRDEAVAKANELLQIVIDSWELLSDPQRKAAFDASEANDNRNNGYQYGNNQYQNNDFRGDGSSHTFNYNQNSSNAGTHGNSSRNERTRGDLNVTGLHNFSGGHRVDGNLSGVGVINCTGDFKVTGSINGTITLNVQGSARIVKDINAPIAINAGGDLRIGGNINAPIAINAGGDLRIGGDINTPIAIKVTGDYKLKGKIHPETTINGKTYVPKASRPKHREASFTFGKATFNTGGGGSDYSSMQINGMCFYSNGLTSINNGNVITQGATYTSIQIEGRKLEIFDADIRSDMMVHGGKVKLDGTYVQTTSETFDLKEICPELKSVANNHNMSYSQYNMF